MPASAGMTRTLKMAEPTMVLAPRPSDPVRTAGDDRRRLRKARPDRGDDRPLDDLREAVVSREILAGTPHSQALPSQTAPVATSTIPTANAVDPAMASH